MLGQWLSYASGHLNVRRSLGVDHRSSVHRPWTTRRTKASAELQRGRVVEDTLRKPGRQIIKWRKGSPRAHIQSKPSIRRRAATPRAFPLRRAYGVEDAQRPVFSLFCRSDRSRSSEALSA